MYKNIISIFSESVEFVIGYKIFRIVLKNSEIIVTMSQRNTDIDIFEMTSIYFKLCELARLRADPHTINIWDKDIR